MSNIQTSLKFESRQKPEEKSDFSFFIRENGGDMLSESPSGEGWLSHSHFFVFFPISWISRLY